MTCFRTKLLTGLAAVAAMLWATVADAAPKTHAPASGSELSSLLNTENGPAGPLELGDTIVLQANTSYVGSFTLPEVTAGTGYITIQSSNLAQLPPDGQRVFPADAPNMPKIRTADGATSTKAMKTAARAHHYKLIGLEFIAMQNVPASPSNYQTTIVEFGNDLHTALIDVPHDIIMDRCIVRASDTSQKVRHAVQLHSASTDVINSYIYDIKESSTDATGIGGYNGPGPYNIINNYIEATAEAIIFGGGTPRITDMVPSDIVVRRNHLTKNPQWIGTSFGWLIKNHFELKAGRRVTVDGNVMNLSWNGAGGQAGKAITFKNVRLTGQGASWTATEEITVSNNLVYDCGIGVAFGGSKNPDNTTLLGWPKNVAIRNNLFYNVRSGTITGPSGSSTWGSGFFIQLTEGAENITFDHNTAFATNSICSVDGPAVPGFVYTNNMTNRGIYGFKGTATSSGRNTFNTWFSTMVWAKNVLAIAGSSSPTSSYLPEWAGGWELSPFNNGNLGYPTSWTNVLQNQSAPGTDFTGYKVVGWDQPTNTSAFPYNNTGTDGKDIGCDIDVMNAATAGCISGVWGPPPSPPAAPSNLAATAASESQIDLTWADNSSDETNFELDRATDSTFTFGLVTTTLGANVTSSSATGLAASSTYYFRVRATNSGGASAYSNMAIAITQAPDTTPPASPTGLVAATVSSSQINLDWANNTESDLAGYNVYRSIVTGGPYTKVNDSLLTTSAFNDTGLTAATTYYYVVRAVDTSLNESANSAQASATTQSSGGATTMHVSSIVVTVTGNGGNKRGRATITVVNNLGQTVSNATVTGDFTGTFTESGRTGVTNSSGVATITTNGKSGGSPSVTFTVTNITHASLSYNPSANVETSDSN